MMEVADEEVFALLIEATLSTIPPPLYFELTSNDLDREVREDTFVNPPLVEEEAKGEKEGMEERENLQRRCKRKPQWWCYLLVSLQF